MAQAAELVDISVSRMWTGVDPVESKIDEYREYNVRRLKQYDAEKAEYRVMTQVLGAALLVCLISAAVVLIGV